MAGGGRGGRPGSHMGWSPEPQPLPNCMVPFPSSTKYHGSSMDTHGASMINPWVSMDSHKTCLRLMGRLCWWGWGELTVTCLDCFFFSFP